MKSNPIYPAPPSECKRSPHISLISRRGHPLQGHTLPSLYHLPLHRKMPFEIYLKLSLECKQSHESVSTMGLACMHVILGELSDQAFTESWSTFQSIWCSASPNEVRLDWELPRWKGNSRRNQFDSYPTAGHQGRLKACSHLSTFLSRYCRAVEAKTASWKHLAVQIFQSGNFLGSW